MKVKTFYYTLNGLTGNVHTMMSEIETQLNAFLAQNPNISIINISHAHYSNGIDNIVTAILLYKQN